MEPPVPKPRIPETNTILDIMNKDFTDFPVDIERSGLIAIRASGNRIGALPRHLPQLSLLNLASNQLSAIPPEMAKSILRYKKLQDLDFSGNQLSEWPSAFDHLKKIRKLHVTNNRLQTFACHCRTLEELHAGQNRLTTFPNVPANCRVVVLDFNLITELTGSFDGLSQLCLSLNSLTSIARVTFSRLESLDISRNRLSKLPDLAAVAPKLRRVDCSDNFLTEFPSLPRTTKEFCARNNRISRIPNLAVDCPLLETLDVSDNRVTQIMGLPGQLTFLALTHNQLEAIPAFSAPRLARIRFQHNVLTTLPNIGQNQIDNFICPWNRIAELDLRCFSHALQRIDLIENRLRALPVELFRLPVLKSLVLCRNMITEIPEEFAVSKTLTLLNLTGNPLWGLPDRWPPCLQSLLVAGCGLTSVPNSLASVESLSTFIASDNELTTLPALPCISLHLSQNHFASLPPLAEGLMKLDMSCNALTSLSDRFVYEALVELDLSHNDLVELPSAFSLPAVKSFKISHNPRLTGAFDASGARRLQILHVEGTNLSVPQLPTIRELMTSDEELFTDESVKLIRDSVSVGFAELCGPRDQMEDAIVVREDLRDGISVFAVFDGHAGLCTATAAAFLIAKDVQERGEFTPAFLAGAFGRMNDRLKALNFQDGATAVVVLKKDRRLITAHLGDARAVVIQSNGDIRFQTADHRPTGRKEYERIRDAGGCVMNGRTAGFLAVSRALGDLRVLGIGHEPEMNEVQLEDGDRWLLVACDGVFDVVFEDLTRVVATAAGSAVQLAYAFRNWAHALMSLDNVSAIVVDLRDAVEPSSEPQDEEI